VREHPLISVLSQAQKIGAFSQRLAGKVEERVHLMGARRRLLKAKQLQLRGQSFNVTDFKLYFDFVAGGHLNFSIAM
jgi:hypothetical protein